ncbi:MAG: hypothetical protein M3O30_14375 [Planctomycetota bacterium]|nr:hypothetical protein [Planctomycetota bacterium]
MKSARHKKLLGLSIGERSLLAAEVVVGDKPRVRRVAEMVYPEGVSIAQPAELGAALAHFLRENDFTCRTAVVGISARSLVVKSKEVPPADVSTLIPMLRLQAEADFSSELKDLVYDFVSDEEKGAATRSVLLLATQRKFIESVQAFCEAARVQPIAITPSALVLGEATGGALKRNVLVLSVGPGGSELTSQHGVSSGAIRHLRPISPQPAFVSELRRAVSTLPGTGAVRELILWDGAGVDSRLLGENLGVEVRAGELPSLGVDTSIIGLNGEGPKYAGAISLAMSGLKGGPTVDFLHSRLAPPRESRIPKWATAAVLGLIVVIAGAVWAYQNEQSKQQQLNDIKSQIDVIKPDVDAATKFVGMAGLAQYWHGDDGRFVACLRDITDALPQDGQTYVTSIEINSDKPRVPGVSSSGKVLRVDDSQPLSITIEGKTTDSGRVFSLVQRMRNNPAFTEVKRGQEGRTGRAQLQAWQFSINFNYATPRQSPAGAKAAASNAPR